MFIIVSFGYEQTLIFNSDSGSTALLDAISQQSTKAIQKSLNTAEANFQKKVAEIEKRQSQNASKREKSETKEQKFMADLEKKAEDVQQKVSTMTLEIYEQQQQAAAEKDKKGAKGKKKGAEEVVTPEYTEEEQELINKKLDLERERRDLIKQGEDLEKDLATYQSKLQKLVEERARFDGLNISELDLQDVTSGEFKSIKDQNNVNGTTFLAPKSSYKLVFKQNEEEEFQPLLIDGFVIRTVEEDVEWERLEAERQAEQPKKGKKKQELKNDFNLLSPFP